MRDVIPSQDSIIPPSLVLFTTFYLHPLTPLTPSLEVEHNKLSSSNTTSLADLSASKKECVKLADERDRRDNENKRVVAENTKLSIELADLKKALAR